MNNGLVEVPFLDSSFRVGAPEALEVYRVCVGHADPTMAGIIAHVHIEQAYRRGELNWRYYTVEFSNAKYVYEEPELIEDPEDEVLDENGEYDKKDLVVRAVDLALHQAMWAHFRDNPPSDFCNPTSYPHLASPGVKPGGNRLAKADLK